MVIGRLLAMADRVTFVDRSTLVDGGEIVDLAHDADNATNGLGRPNDERHRALGPTPT
jgi:hypothetical protein